MPKVVVYGSFVVDLVCETPHLPTPGQTVLAGPFRKGPGGKGSNQAVAAAMAGARARLITKVGDDEFTSIAAAVYTKTGMDAGDLLVTTDAPTGVALIMVDANGENCITVAPGACLTMTEDEVLPRLEAILEPGDVFITQFETDLTVTLAALQRAKSLGAVTILNPAPVPAELPGDFLSQARPDIITPNETEAAALTGIVPGVEIDAQAACEALCNMGVGTAVITMGGEGAYAYGSMMPEGRSFPAHDVAAVDTTGAGDAFNGGLAAGLSMGLSFDDAMAFAAATAALSVTRPGTAGSMPVRDEIDAFMTNRR